MHCVEVVMEVFRFGKFVLNVEGEVKQSSMDLLLFRGCSESKF